MFDAKELKKRRNKRLKEIHQEVRETGVEEYGWAVTAFSFGPQAELLARMNARVQGIDPGEPVNWRGL